ncbi:restriction endonuclease [Pseudooceanicola pacificus]|nr:restriction endonuclease [Pseudooceanicola pacificus]
MSNGNYSTMSVSVFFRTRFGKQIVHGPLQVKWSARGDRILPYYVDVRHLGLNLHKELSAPEVEILQNKIDTLLASWDTKFEAAQQKQDLQKGRELAEETAIDAEAAREELRNVLMHTLGINDEVDWDSLKSRESYIRQPFGERAPAAPQLVPLPDSPKIGFFDKLFGKSRQIQERHNQATQVAVESRTRRQKEHAAALESWQMRKQQWKQHQELEAVAFDKRQAAANALVDDLRNRWRVGEPEAIVEHAALVLDSSSYNEVVPRNHDLSFDPESKTLLVEFELPDPEALPLTKSVRFVAKTGELKESKISQKEARDLYDDLCYQICLRTIHELFEADTLGYISTIVFNGVTDTVNKATGQNVRSVIMSVMVDRPTFEAIELSRVDPKTCFKTLKGVSASSLAGLAPIPPIMSISKEDRRFIDSQDVSLDDAGTTNLAAMNWEEFEHLVRQIFEREFASRGGEVKVTQSSSDGGVDAVAFDPDPISGGKIVIQAKRYTKTVGVSAVRDLYGTVMNEGASKGILVTTADFGPDAHKFASGKPITLMSGANLLFLLEKHGTRAKIDLESARKELGLSIKAPRI